MRPVVVVMENRSIETVEYLKTLTMRCCLNGFEHLFNTTIETVDSVDDDAWLDHPTLETVPSECRSKRKEDM